MTRLFIPRLLKDRSYTLVEALLTILILALIMLAMVPFISTVYTTWNLGDRKTELQQNARVGLDVMSRYLRQAKRITGIPVSGSGNFVEFRVGQMIGSVFQEDTQTITFFYNVAGCPYYIGNTGLIKNNDLVIQAIDISGTITNALLAKSLNNFSINFKNSLGQVATKPYDVYSMDINMSLSDPQGLIPDILNIFSTISLRPQVRIDKPVWLAYGNSIAELSRDVVITGFSSPGSVSVNNTLLVNGRETVWVADRGGNRIRRIYWNGSNWVYDTITGFSSPSSVSVNPNETVNGRETCWVADTGGNRIGRIVWTGSAWSYSVSGGATITGFSGPCSVSVNPNETINTRNTCWVADTGGNRVRKIYWSGSVYTYINLTMGPGSSPLSVSVNTADNTCWVADSGTHPNNGNRVRKIDSGNTSYTQFTGFSTPYAVSVNSVTGECWVADTGNNRIKRIGTINLNLTGFLSPQYVWANLSENSCWVADTNNNQIVKLDFEGNEEFRISSFQLPLSVAGVP